MRRTFLVTACCLLFMTVAAGASEHQRKFVPPAGKILLIIGQDRTSIDNYVAQVGPVPGGLMFYTSIQKMDGLETAADTPGGIHDARYLVDKYPGAVLQIGLWMVGAEDEIVSGKYDRNIDALSAWVKRIRRPVFLRIGYEFDLALNEYRPRAYARAFRYIVNKMRKSRVTNVAFVWHSYGSLPRYAWERWYPGDAYVDWFAVSVFNKPNIYMKKFAELAKKHGKPFMIAESAPQGIGTRAGQGSWDYWFKDYFRFIAENDVKVVSYINYDWELIPMFRGQGWGDSRIEGNEVVKKNWLDEIGKDKYLKASPGLYESLGYK